MDIREARAHLFSTAETQTDATDQHLHFKDQGQQWPEDEMPSLTPDMLADRDFVQKALQLYAQHTKSQDLTENINITDTQTLTKEDSQKSTLTVKTGYAISKVEAIQVQRFGGRTKYKDDRRRSAISNEWISKEEADAEKASGIAINKKRISKGNSDLSCIKEKIMHCISEKYRSNRREVYARANLNKNLGRIPTLLPCKG